jgi:hypothetical protein
MHADGGAEVERRIGAILDRHEHGERHPQCEVLTDVYKQIKCE